VSGFLVLWDVDYTLVNTSGVGIELYRLAFADLYGTRLPPAAEAANMAGRTDRAIAIEVLGLAGIADPVGQVARFEATLTRLAPRLADLVAATGIALPGAADALAALAAAGQPARLAANRSGVLTGSAAAGADPADTGPAGAGTACAGAAGTGPAGTGTARAGTAGAARAGTACPDRAPLVRQSLLTGNVRALAEVKLGPLHLTTHLDLDVGAYGNESAIRADLVGLARQRATAAYGAEFGGEATVLVGDTPLDVAAALAAGARAVGVATGRYSMADLAQAGAHVVLPDLADTERVVAAVLPDRAPGYQPRPA